MITFVSASDFPPVADADFPEKDWFSASDFPPVADAERFSQMFVKLSRIFYAITEQRKRIYGASWNLSARAISPQ